MNDIPRNDGYRVYTRKFDKEIRAGDLDLVIGPLSPRGRTQLNEAWATFQGALQNWRARLQIEALNASSRTRNLISSEKLDDTVAAILIDHSGSMRGQNMLMAAATADLAADFLIRLGAKVEILGFTTTSWKGGKSRRRWKWWPRRNPGRLCDLLHIVYRGADCPNPSASGNYLQPMLRPDLPKENVDGEAIEWVAGRLRQRAEKHKLVLVLSDGAPVDDSTLLANGPDYLDRHLQQVVEEIEKSNDIEIVAVGIGSDPSRYYSKCSTVNDPDDLGEAAISLLEKLLLKDGTVKSD